MLQIAALLQLKDSTGPTITQISNQSSEVYNPIHPITISTTDNSGAKVVSAEIRLA